jgi:hypothetical protein
MNPDNHSRLRAATPEQIADTVATLLSLPVASTETRHMAYTLYFAQHEAIEALLDRYVALQPNYAAIIERAAREQVITRLQALVFSLEDRKFLRGLALDEQECMLYTQLQLLLHPEDDEFALGQY